MTSLSKVLYISYELLLSSHDLQVECTCALVPKSATVVLVLAQQCAF